MIKQEIPYQAPTTLLNCLPLKNLVFLDSSITTNNTLGRYSYLAVDPFDILQATTVNSDSPLHAISAFLQRFSLPKDPDLPPFQGGLAGYFAYELAFTLETCKSKHISKKSFPYHPYQLGCFDLLISFDHYLKKAWIVSTGFPETKTSQRLLRAEKRRQWLDGMLSQPLQHTTSTITHIPTPRCQMSHGNYIDAVKRIINYIKAGDIFQANLARCYQSTLNKPLDVIALYKKLRHANPAPFAALLNFSPCCVLSSSPERFLQLSNQTVETRPIKGTIHRSENPSEDRQLEKQLMQSEKDRAENIMIVDLMRNDLSKVCEPDSIAVKQLCQPESYEKVHHLVSVIHGKLKPNQSIPDLLAAAFPGGSITGAPKIRAIEIIDELENTQRGPYCGAIGYLGFNQEMDTSITIRTLLLTEKELLFHSGSAITLASDPEKEYQETQVKAEALKDAIR